jgi:hypothetical protein
MSSPALLEAEIPSPLYVTGKNNVDVIFGVYGGCCCLSFMYNSVEVYRLNPVLAVKRSLFVETRFLRSIFDRPGVAGAVLQTASSFIN